MPVVFAVVLILGGFVNAAFDLPDPGLTPESPIYFLDLWDEQARLFFARSDSSRVKRYRAHVLERLSEAETLAGRGISATQRALELYRAELPFFYAAAERLDDVSILENISYKNAVKPSQAISDINTFIISSNIKDPKFTSSMDFVDGFFTEYIYNNGIRAKIIFDDNGNATEIISSMDSAKKISTNNEL